MADADQDAFDAQAFAQITGAGTPPSPAPAPTDQPKPEAQASAEVESKPAPVDRSKAMAALRYSTVPQSMLDKATDDELHEWSQSYREAEAKTKTELQQRSEETKRLRDELGRFQSQPETAKAAEPNGSTADLDLEAELKPIVDELREMGVPAGNKLATILKALNASQKAQVEGLSTVNKQLVGEVLSFFKDQSRSKLEAQYPQLSDDAVWAKVEEEGKPLLANYGDLSARQAYEKAYSKAAKLVLFDDIVKAQSEQVINQHRKRVQGAPTAPTRQQEARPMNDEERDLAVARALIDGKPDDALRIARG